MHQREIGWTCLRQRPWQTLAKSSDPQCQTHGTHLRCPYSPARSLRQLKERNDHNRQTSIYKYSHKFK
jgi:hypothetical protein